MHFFLANSPFPVNPPLCWSFSFILNNYFRNKSLSNLVIQIFEATKGPNWLCIVDVILPAGTSPCWRSWSAGVKDQN